MSETKILAQLTISVAEGVDGQPGAINIAWTPGLNEVMVRFLIDKGRASLDDHFRMQNAPKVLPAGNGVLRRLHG